MTASSRAVELARLAAEAAERIKASDVVALDVSGQLPLTDVFVLASGNSERQVAAIVDEVERGRRRDAAAKPRRIEGRSAARWVLVDYGDIVVHVQHEEDRAYYGLDRLWRDSPLVDLDESDAQDVQGEDSSPDEADRRSADGRRIEGL